MPGFRILAKCKLKNINKLEKKYITMYRNLNPNLTNERSGGDGWNMVRKLGKENWNNAIESNKKQVIARNIKTGEETLYNSILECSNSIESNPKTISTILNGKRNKRILY